MSQQAIVILMDWATQNTLEAQEKFSIYLEKLIAEHYGPKQVYITGRTMEAIIENYETEVFTEQSA